jgi:hypothetical protein
VSISKEDVGELVVDTFDGTIYEVKRIIEKPQAKLVTKHKITNYTITRDIDKTDNFKRLQDLSKEDLITLLGSDITKHM